MPSGGPCFNWSHLPSFCFTSNTHEVSKLHRLVHMHDWKALDKIEQNTNSYPAIFTLTRNYQLSNQFWVVVHHPDNLAMHAYRASMPLHQTKKRNILCAQKVTHDRWVVVVMWYTSRQTIPRHWIVYLPMAHLYFYKILYPLHLLVLL